jgi:hypothetical protein
MSFQQPPLNTALRMCRPQEDGTYDVYPIVLNVGPEEVKQALDAASWKLAIVRDRDGRQLMLYGSSIVGLDPTEEPPDRLPVLGSPGAVNVTPRADLVAEVTLTALQMISAERTGMVDGEKIAAELGRGPHDMDMYYAYREIQRRGELDFDAWRGGMGLPGMVKLP